MITKSSTDLAKPNSSMRRDVGKNVAPSPSTSPTTNEVRGVPAPNRSPLVKPSPKGRDIRIRTLLEKLTSQLPHYRLSSALISAYNLPQNVNVDGGLDKTATSSSFMFDSNSLSTSMPSVTPWERLSSRSRQQLAPGGDGGGGLSNPVPVTVARVLGMGSSGLVLYAERTLTTQEALQPSKTGGTDGMLPSNQVSFLSSNSNPNASTFASSHQTGSGQQQQQQQPSSTTRRSRRESVFGFAIKFIDLEQSEYHQSHFSIKHAIREIDALSSCDFFTVMKLFNCFFIYSDGSICTDVEEVKREQAVRAAPAASWRKAARARTGSSTRAIPTAPDLSDHSHFTAHATPQDGGEPPASIVSIVIEMEYLNNGDLASEIKKRREAIEEEKARWCSTLNVLDISREAEFDGVGTHPLCRSFKGAMPSLSSCYFSKQDLTVTFFQILAGIYYLHERQEIMHRDVKSENVLLSGQGSAKIGDFGFSKHFDLLDSKLGLSGTASRVRSLQNGDTSDGSSSYGSSSSSSADDDDDEDDDGRRDSNSSRRAVGPPGRRSGVGVSPCPGRRELLKSALATPVGNGSSGAVRGGSGGGPATTAAAVKAPQPPPPSDSDADREPQQRFISARQKVNSFCGTPLYMAPEMWRRETDYNSKIDLFSLGVILYEMLTLQQPQSVQKSLSASQTGRTFSRSRTHNSSSAAANPWDGISSSTTLRKKKMKERHVVIPDDTEAFVVRVYGQAYYDLLTQLLKSNPTERPSVMDVLSRFPLFRCTSGHLIKYLTTERHSAMGRESNLSSPSASTAGQQQPSDEEVHDTIRQLLAMHDDIVAYDADNWRSRRRAVSAFSAYRLSHEFFASPMSVPNSSTARKADGHASPLSLRKAEKPFRVIVEGSVKKLNGQGVWKSRYLMLVQVSITLFEVRNGLAKEDMAKKDGNVALDFDRFVDIFATPGEAGGTAAATAADGGAPAFFEFALLANSGETLQIRVSTAKERDEWLANCLAARDYLNKLHSQRRLRQQPQQERRESGAGPTSSTSLAPTPSKEAIDKTSARHAGLTIATKPPLMLPSSTNPRSASARTGNCTPMAVDTSRNLSFNMPTLLPRRSPQTPVSVRRSITNTTTTANTSTASTLTPYGSITTSVGADLSGNDAHGERNPSTRRVLSRLTGSVLDGDALPYASSESVSASLGHRENRDGVVLGDTNMVLSSPPATPLSKDKERPRLEKPSGAPPRKEPAEGGSSAPSIAAKAIGACPRQTAAMNRLPRIGENYFLRTPVVTPGDKVANNTPLSFSNSEQKTMNGRNGGTHDHAGFILPMKPHPPSPQFANGPTKLASRSHLTSGSEYSMGFDMDE